MRFRGYMPAWLFGGFMVAVSAFTILTAPLQNRSTVWAVAGTAVAGAGCLVLWGALAWAAISKLSERRRRGAPEK